MQIITTTEYQDLYRVKDGVLLVINKFEPITYGPENKTYHLYNKKYKSYAKDCQKELKVLKQDYFDEFEGITIPEGTVTYIGFPVIATTDKSKWDYQIKTTGTLFSGTQEEMLKMITDIENIIANS